MALGRRRRQPQKFVPPKLMLTSMMDMFTIILIFLLFSFSENPETIKLDADLELPHSSAELGYQKAIKIVLSKKELRLNDELMAEVRDRKIIGLATDDLASSTLYQRLKAKRSEQIASAQQGENPESPHILFWGRPSVRCSTISLTGIPRLKRWSRSTRVFAGHTRNFSTR